jgi:hypothetical protein
MADELYPAPDDLGLGATLRGFVKGENLFGRYVLQRILGRGGMGVVWLAHDEQLDRDVALKFLPELITLDREAIADLKRETRHSLELTHPNIVRIYDFVQNSSWAGISMEYVEGETLSSLKVGQPDGHFEVEALRPWVRQLTEALEYAHTRAKVVHRDLKPANLMINHVGELKVADFGIAKSLSDSATRITIRGGSSGTLVYMSPQQANGQPVAATDDIYSLGATLYDLLSGKAPFYSGNIQHQLENIVPPSIARRRAELGHAGEPIPAQWEETIAGCLEKNPADRPESVVEVAERLDLISAPLRSKRIKPRKKPASSSSGPNGRWPLFIGATVVVLLLLGYLGYHFGVEVPARQAEMAQQQAMQKQKEAKALADQKAAEEAAAKTAADQKAKDDAAKAKALADQTAAKEAADQAAAAQAAADQKAKDDAAKAKALADQTAAKEAADQAAAAQAAAAQKAKDDAAKAAAANPKKTPPWENSLGMKFVAAGTPGVLVSIFDTRVQDYAAFVEATDYETTGGMYTYDNDGWKQRGTTWKNPGFEQGPDCPVVGVCWDDAKAFCQWLTTTERKEGKLKSSQVYRLPTDAEWSKAVGLEEMSDGTPQDKNDQVQDVYPWGTRWPPPPGSGNFADMSARTRYPTLQTIYGYTDGYVNTSPVGSFKPNRYGLYDMAGNVWQWCEDWFNESHQWHVLRGGSWTISSPASFLSSGRYNFAPPLHPGPDFGFRCVMADSSP